jgi:uncharacterized protein YcbK (DUF882 family)
MTTNWKWKNFTPDEMRCKGTGKLLVIPEFMDRLQRLREAMNIPLVVSSGYRAPEHNEKVSSTGPNGPHTTGRAVDLKIYGPPAHKLIFVAINLGFTGIGVKQHGPVESRFIHLDDLPDAARRQRPTIWSY